MSILSKLSDVLKEVFWLKPSKKKAAKRAGASKKRTTKKAPIKKRPTFKKKVAVKPAPVKKPLKAVLKPVKAPKVKAPSIDPNLKEIGVITHYFDRIKVGVVKVTQGSILIGDKLVIIGPKTKLPQKVWSMQIESKDVKVARKGQLVGLKIDKPIAVGDKVYK